VVTRQAQARSPSPPAPLASTALGQEAPRLNAKPGGHLKPLVEFMHAGLLCARARVYLYQAPFSPSVCYARGTEYFMLIAGWGMVRSRQGLLIWLELLDDLCLADLLPAQTPPTGLGGGSAPLAHERVTGAAASYAAQGGETDSTFALRLPAAAGLALGQVDIHQLRSCAVDSMIRVPCEDVMVLHPQDSAGGGLKASLGSGPGRQSFDGMFKAWLSSWEAQV